MDPQRPRGSTSQFRPRGFWNQFEPRGTSNQFGPRGSPQFKPRGPPSLSTSTDSPPQSATLYVGDLHPDVREVELYEKFSSVGPVLSIRVCLDVSTRRSLGYAYVNFQRRADAEHALDTLNFSSLQGRPMRLMWSQKDPSQRESGSGNVFVKNLEKSIDNKALSDAFAGFGNILSCKVAFNENGVSKGHGFIQFEKEKDGQRAIEELNGTELRGKVIHVGEFLNRQQRTQEQNSTGNTKVFVKNLGPPLEEEQITELFSQFGNILSLELKKRSDGKPKGFGFLCYEKSEEAEQAIQQMNGYELPATGIKGAGNYKPAQKLFTGRAWDPSEHQQYQWRNPQLQSSSNSSTVASNFARGQGQDLKKKSICPICLEDYEELRSETVDTVSTACGHIFCRHCLERWLLTENECPTCRERVNERDIRKVFV